MSEILSHTGAKLWGKDDYGEVWLSVFDEITGTGGKSNFRLIDEAIGKINERLDGYYFKFEDNRLFICKDLGDDNDSVQETIKYNVTIINDKEDIATHVDDTTIFIDKNGTIYGRTSEEIRSEITSKNVTDALGYTPPHVIVSKEEPSEYSTFWQQEYE
jgi:hypothetical protein